MGLQCIQAAERSRMHRIRNEAAGGGEGTAASCQRTGTAEKDEMPVAKLRPPGSKIFPRGKSCRPRKFWGNLSIRSGGFTCKKQPWGTTGYIYKIYGGGGVKRNPQKLDGAFRFIQFNASRTRLFVGSNEYHMVQFYLRNLFGCSHR